MKNIKIELTFCFLFFFSPFFSLSLFQLSSYVVYVQEFNRDRNGWLLEWVNMLYMWEPCGLLGERKHSLPLGEVHVSVSSIGRSLFDFRGTSF